MMGMRYYTSPTHEFIVLDIEKNELWPQVGTLRSLDDLWNIDPRNEEFEVLHD